MISRLELWLSGKSTCCLSMRTHMQITVTHVKSNAHNHCSSSTPVTKEEVETGESLEAQSPAGSGDAWGSHTSNRKKRKLPQRSPHLCCEKHTPTLTHTEIISHTIHSFLKSDSITCWTRSVSFLNLFYCGIHWHLRVYLNLQNICHLSLHENVSSIKK